MRIKEILLLSVGVILAAGCGDHPTSVELTPKSMNSAPFADPGAALGWQARARTLVAAGSLNPMAASRVYAAVSVAQYKAVVAVNEQATGDATLPDDGGGRNQFEAQRGAIAGASAQVLAFFFPAAAATLDQQVATEANSGAGDVHPAFTEGLNIGRVAGDASILRVRSDRFTAPWTGTLPTGPGSWVANGPPAGPSIGGAVPYFMTSGSQFRPAPPPVYLSAEFNTALDQVKAFSLSRTPAQIASVIFWNYGPTTPTPPGYFNEVASAYSVEQGLDETATTQVFAVMHAAIFDAVVACWDAKYHYSFLRPSQADPTISLVIGLPNHPSYPSGHSCVSAAAGTVLTHYFPNHAADLANTVVQAGLSRILGGIHYSFDITAGNGIGTSVGRLAIDTGF